MVELTLEGPGKNALSTAVLEGLLAQLDAAEGQPLLLTGAGDALSAGVNLKEIATLPPEGIAHFLALLDQVVRRLYLWPAPTLVAVRGAIAVAPNAKGCSRRAPRRLSSTPLSSPPSCSCCSPAVKR